MDDLAAKLPILLPRAIEWAYSESGRCQAHGLPLKAPGTEIARRVGVLRPWLIRAVWVNELPRPSDPDLLAAAGTFGLFDGTGLTLGYSRCCVTMARNRHFALRQVWLDWKTCAGQRGLGPTFSRLIRR